MHEAKLEDCGSGLAPVTEGWFIVNVRDAEWWFAETRGARCGFENEYGDRPVEFAQLGINVTVLEPGQTTLYHAESNQEAFLVLAGECALIVEGQERRLRPWDFFHAPPWTEHAFAGAGDGPCVILMAGSRSGPEVRYPVSELAARHGACVAEETTDWREAYATVERFRREQPPTWARLPWGAERVGLRPVRETDLEIFYEQQRDPEAAAMAMFPSRDRETFFHHWHTRVLGRPDARSMTVTYGDAVAGNIGCWAADDEVFVGYWIGRDYWGKGVATAALRTFLAEHEPRRPVHAHVVSSNTGSIRVLEKCGFELVGSTSEVDEASGILVEELLMVYERSTGSSGFCSHSDQEPG